MNGRRRGRTAPRARRAPKRRRPPAALVILAAAVLVVAAVVAVNWTFTVRRLDVAGSGDVDPQQVARMSGIRLGERMWSVDAAKVRGGVENDGRLAFVSLERRLPGGLLLTVRQRTTDAVAMQAGKVLALDEEGYVIAALDRFPDVNLPYVSGLRPAKYTVGRQLDTMDGRVPTMTEILRALRAGGGTGYVAEIDLASLVDLKIITRKGVTVLLGDTEDLPRKIAWMTGAVADLEARGESGGRLDVSSGSKADYRPPEGAGEPAAEAEAAPEAAGES